MPFCSQSSLSPQIDPLLLSFPLPFLVWIERHYFLLLPLSFRFVSVFLPLPFSFVLHVLFFSSSSLLPFPSFFPLFLSSLSFLSFFPLFLSSLSFFSFFPLFLSSLSVLSFCPLPFLIVINTKPWFAIGPQKMIPCL